VEQKRLTHFFVKGQLFAPRIIFEEDPVWSWKQWIAIARLWVNFPSRVWRFDSLTLCKEKHLGNCLSFVVPSAREGFNGGKVSQDSYTTMILESRSGRRGSKAHSSSRLALAIRVDTRSCLWGWKGYIVDAGRVLEFRKDASWWKVDYSQPCK
jgi:hypothetical protein